MDPLIFNVLQDKMQINSLHATVRHTKGHKEKGSKRRYDLWIITSGSIEYTYDERNYTLNKGDLFLMYPNVYYESLVTSEHLDLIFCRFDFSLGNSTTDLTNFPIAGYISHNDYRDSSLHKSLNQFIQSFRAERNDVFLINYITKQYFNILMADFFEHQLRVNTNINSSSETYISSKLHKLIPAIDYMSSNINKSIPTWELAELVHMSPKYFITYFRQVLGITPHQYQIQHKMLKASALIKEQQYSIKEISDQLGYSDQYNFSTAFKKHFGSSPSHYIHDGEMLTQPF